MNADGNVILAEHVAAAVRRQLEPGIGDLRGLRTAPALQLSSPLARPRIVVTGIDAEGREHDVSGIGLGTHLTDAAGHLATYGDGAVRALRRGPSTLRVGNGTLAADVAVTADWPDLFDGDDARPAPGGERPALRIVSGGLDGATTAITLQCTDLPAGGMRLLVAADRPLPFEPQPPGHAEGIHAVPLDAAAPVSTASLPLPAAVGLPMFLRVFVLGDGAAVVAASNTLVITRG